MGVVVVVEVEVGMEGVTHKEVEDGAVAVIIQVGECHQAEEGDDQLKIHVITSILHGVLVSNVMRRNG
jgi:hypothetical protein